MEDIFENHFRDEVPSRDRVLIIGVSVRVEDLIGMCLSRQLGLKEARDTRSFGPTSNALPFNSKLNLFLDLQGISKEEADILSKFSIIRNKFAHLLDIATIFDCLEADRDKILKKFFEKYYREKIVDYAYTAAKVTEMLPLFLDDVEMTCGNILNRMFERIGEEIAALAKAKKMQFLMANLADYQSMSPEVIAFMRQALEKTKQQHKEYDYTDEVIALI